MNLFNVILFYFLYETLSANDTAFLIYQIKRISSDQFWKDNFMTQEIIIDNKRVLLERALKVITNFDYAKYTGTYYDNITQLNELDAFKASKALYTAQKCKYSNLVIDVLRTFFESISLCQKLIIIENSRKNVQLSNKINKSLNQIIKRIVDLKKYIVKFIFNINILMTLTPTLRSTDHTLTKSLLSINVCLHHIKCYIVQHNNDASGISSKIDVQKLIAQMINMVERFRCKYCYIRDYYYNSAGLGKKNIYDSLLDDINCNSVDSLVKNTLQGLNIYFDDMTLFKHFLVSDTVFDEEMYDPKHILLENIFEMVEYSFIPTLFVRWKNSTDWLPLIEVYNDVSKSYDLQTMYEYQVFLVEVIKNIFYIKVVNKKIVSFDNIREILVEFDEFMVQFIPKNYPTDLYDEMKKLRNSLYNDLQSTESLPALSNYSIELLYNISIITTLDKDSMPREIQLMSMNKLSMREFMDEIAALYKFKIFIDTFEELSYESNSLEDYSLQPEINNIKIIEQNNNEKICYNLSLLRKNLTLFQTLILGFQHARIDFRNVDGSNIIWEAQTYVFDCVMHLYKTYINHQKIRQIVLPLAIRFNYARKNKNDFKMLSQVTFLNVNIIEHFELNNCLSPEYSLNVKWYNKKKNHKTMNFLELGNVELHELFWNDRKSIMSIIKSHSGDYYMENEKKRNLHALAVNKFVPNLYLNDYFTRESYPALFLWDGSMKSIETVLNSVPRDIIDHQYLVRHQCCLIKWVISRVFTHFLDAIRIYFPEKNKKAHLNDINTTLDYLTQFEELPFPKFIKIHLRDMFAIFNHLLKVPTKENMDKYRSVIIDQLELSPQSFEDSTSSISGQRNIFKFTNIIIEKGIRLLRIVLKSSNDNELVSRVQFSSCMYV